MKIGSGRKLIISFESLLMVSLSKQKLLFYIGVCKILSKESVTFLESLGIYLHFPFNWCCPCFQGNLRNILNFTTAVI